MPDDPTSIPPLSAPPSPGPLDRNPTETHPAPPFGRAEQGYRSTGAPGARRRLWLIGVLLLLAVPFLWQSGRTEVGRWRMAKALDSELDGNLAEARRWADEAVDLAPRSPTLLYQRAMIAIAQGEPQQALADCELGLKSSPDDHDLQITHMVAAQMLGQHDRAISRAQAMVETARREYQAQRPSSYTVARYALALNTLAYARAQAKLDLDQALEEIDEALRLVANEPRFRDDPSMLDTRGYIQYLRGEQTAAEADLNRAISTVEALLKATVDQQQEEAQGLVDQRAAQRQLRLRNQSLAVMYHHRGQVYEALGRKNLAQQDFTAAKRMGYAPEKGVY